MNLPFKLELYFDDLYHTCPTHVDEFGTSALDLDHQDQNGLQTSSF